MSRQDRNYWIEQAKKRILYNDGVEDKFAKELAFMYDELAFKVENEISALFGKYAADNKLSSLEAHKLLSSKEYSVWRKSIEGYLAEATGEAADSKIMLELNTLAMKSRISRQEQLLSNIYQNMADLANDSEIKISELLSDVLTTNYERGCYTLQQGIKLAMPVAKISKERVKQILEYPWSTKKFSKNIWENTDRLAAITKRELTMGLISGSSIQKMSKNIDSIMGKGRGVAERLVRTECKYFANMGEIESYKAHGIKKYRFMSNGSDGGHCNCSALSGGEFDIEDAVAGINLPPIHPNCKCYTLSVYDLSIWDNNRNVTPLAENVKFKEWKEKYMQASDKGDIIKLSDDEHHALNTYISSGAYKINEKLRKGSRLTKADKKLVDSLDSALDKMPDYKGTVYRSVSDFGIDDVDKFIKGHNVGTEKLFASYVSTSKKVYDESFPIQYVIKSKQGKDIQSYNQNESEILFKRGTSFTITKVDGHTIYMED